MRHTSCKNSLPLIISVEEGTSNVTTIPKIMCSFINLSLFLLPPHTHKQTNINTHIYTYIHMLFKVLSCNVYISYDNTKGTSACHRCIKLQLHTIMLLLGLMLSSIYQSSSCQCIQNRTMNIVQSKVLHPYVSAIGFRV
jgi:hypothetical protein